MKNGGTSINRVEQGRIVGHQLMAMLVLNRLVPVTVTFPSMTGLASPQEAWISILVSVLATVPIVLWIAYLGQHFPEKTLLQYGEMLLGRVVGKLLGLGFVLYFLSTAARTARELGEAYTIGIMPETPILVFMVVIVFLGANAARGGLEVVGRMAENTFWLFLLFAILVLTLPIGDMKAANLRPLLAHGPWSAISGAATSWAFFTEFLVMGMVMPFLTRPADARRFGLYAVGISGSVATVFAVVIVAIFGVLAPILTLPAFSLGRIIALGDFFERIEIIPMGAWTLGSGIKIACFLWASAVGLAQLCGLRYYQPLVYPLALLSLALGILYFENIVEVDKALDFESLGALVALLTLSVLTLLSLASMRTGHRETSEER